MERELRALLASDQYRGRVPSLREFLDETGLEVGDVYKSGCWSGLKRDAGVPAPHAADDACELRQPAMEEMAATGEYDDRQLLRARPGEDIGERNHIVLFAVNDDRVRRQLRQCR